MVGMAMGFFAVIFCFVGMDCTYIGGSDKAKDRLVFTGAIFHFVGGKQRSIFYSQKKNVVFFPLYYSIPALLV